VALERRSHGIALPDLAHQDYRWLETGAAPETAVRELVFRLMTPRNALAIALGAEKRAQAFFERVLVTDRATRRARARSARRLAIRLPGFLREAPCTSTS
jgi:hypothetical protein